MSLSGVITNFSTGPYTLSRRAADAWADGIRTPGAAATQEIRAHVQPLTPRELQVLPESYHNEDVRLLFTVTPVLIGDEITIDDDTFAAFRVAKWPQPGGGTHYQAHVSRRVRQ